MTAGVCVCSVGLFVSVERACVPHYAFHVSLLLNATCGEMRKYFPNHTIMGKQGHEMYSSAGKITKF